MKVTVYYAPQNDRSKVVAQAMFRGIEACGEEVRMKSSLAYRSPDSDVAVFYGLVGGLARVLAEYPRRGRQAVYVDLGYWHRKKHTRFDGYHKVSVNSRHPTAYFQNVEHPTDRARRLALRVEPWRTSGREVVVAGMSAKASAAEGMAAEQWERKTIARLRRLTPRPIIYRPKPSWHEARPIEGAIFDRKTPLPEVFRTAHAIVTHHSNVGVDALLAGVPVISLDGAASVLGSGRLEDIEEPPRPDGRDQWVADLAYCQWTLDEMRSGLCWQHLVREGLVCA